MEDNEDKTKPQALICSVSSCKSISSDNRNTVYYIFPRDLERCSLWVKRCKQIDLTNSYREHGSWHLSTEYRICSDHFTSADFIDPDNPMKGLKFNAVPSIGVNMEDSDADSLTDSAEPNSTDSQQSPKSHVILTDSDSDSWDEMESDGEGTGSNMKFLKKRLIDSEKENARLKRAVDRLRRQNVKYKRRLS